MRGSRITQQLYIIVQWRILFGNQLGHDVYNWVPIVKWEYKTFANPVVDPQKSCPNKNAESRSLLFPSGQIGEYKISAQDSIEQTLANLLALSRSFYQLIMIGFPEFVEFMLILLYASSS